MSVPNSPIPFRKRTLTQTDSARHLSISGLWVKLIRKVRKAMEKNSTFSKEKPLDTLLSEYEVMLIQESWKPIAADIEYFGRKVYKRVFECEPDLKILFAWPDIKDEELEYNPDFRRQAAAIIGIIDRCVKHADNIEIICEELVSLGKRHVKLRGYGFKPDHWTLFKLSILLSITVECDSAKHKHALFDAWNTLISFIIEAMKYGFEEMSKSFGTDSMSSSNNSSSLTK